MKRWFWITLFLTFTGGISCGLPSEIHWSFYTSVILGGLAGFSARMLWQKINTITCKHDPEQLIGGPACRKCGWTP